VTEGALPDQTNLGSRDAYVRKLDVNGTLLWSSQFGSASGDQVRAVAIDGAGNGIVSGSTSGALPGQANSGSVDVFVRKFGP